MVNYMAITCSLICSSVIIIVLFAIAPLSPDLPERYFFCNFARFFGLVSGNDNNKQ